MRGVPALAVGGGSAAPCCLLYLLVDLCVIHISLSTLSVVSGFAPCGVEVR